MPRVGSVLIMVSLSGLALLAAARDAAAQGAQPPRQLGPDIVGASALSREQVAQIESYIAAHAAAFTAKPPQPEEVEQARAKLLEPLSKLPVSDSFRFEYAKALNGPMLAAIESQSLHAAINAIVVLAQVGTERSLSALLPLTDSRSDARWQVRQHASRACAAVLKSRGLAATKVLDAARRLREAAGREDHNLVLWHQFAAIDAADQTALQPQERQQVRGLFVEALAQVVQRIAQNNNPHPNPRIEATNAAVIMMREKYLVVPVAERRALATALRPVLKQFVEVVGADWQAAQGEPDLKRLLGLVLGTCEGFLPLVNDEVKGAGSSPPSRMREAWERGNRAQFQADLQRWQTALSQ